MKIIYIGFITIINAMVQPFISIQPGGITGFYTLGICSYIKEKYDTSKYNIMGSSSGADGLAEQGLQWLALGLPLELRPIQYPR